MIVIEVRSDFFKAICLSLFINKIIRSYGAGINWYFKAKFLCDFWLSTGIDTFSSLFWLLFDYFFKWKLLLFETETWNNHVVAYWEHKIFLTFVIVRYVLQHYEYTLLFKTLLCLRVDKLNNLALLQAQNDWKQNSCWDGFGLGRIRNILVLLILQHKWCM